MRRGALEFGSRVARVAFVLSLFLSLCVSLAHSLPFLILEIGHKDAHTHRQHRNCIEI